MRVGLWTYSFFVWVGMIFLVKKRRPDLNIFGAEVLILNGVLCTISTKSNEQKNFDGKRMAHQRKFYFILIFLNRETFKYIHRKRIMNKAKGEHGEINRETI